MVIALSLIFGAILGSFTCCQAWRLRYQQKGKKSLGKWSVCLSCKKRLSWYDNIPIFSWLMLRGKCRHCGKKIGLMELLSELGLMSAFGLIAVYFSPQLFPGGALSLIALAQFIVMLALMAVLWVLLLYDAKWGEMPSKLLYAAIIVAAVYRVLSGFDDYISVLGGVLILAGTYFALFFFSHEKLVGSGDWLLCLAIALALGNWWLALITLFLANLLGSVVMLPIAKKTKNHTIHFAPFLIIAFLAVFLLQAQLCSLLIIS